MSLPNQNSPHMLREIFEQPKALRRTLEHYTDRNGFRPEACDPVREWLRVSGGDVLIAASGSSRHAALVAETLIESSSAIHVDVEYASEYPYRSRRTERPSGVLVVSQSGETADTLQSLRRARERGHPTLSITNVPGSTMDLESLVQMPTLAGPELAIPATKSFTAQLLNLSLLSLLAAECHGEGDPERIVTALAELHALPERLAMQLKGWCDVTEELSKHCDGLRSLLFLGRGIHFPIAREGALKLKESAYLHAEGYPSGELKHGPNALVSSHGQGGDTALVLLATQDAEDVGSRERYVKSLLLLRDLQDQSATTLVLCNRGDREVPGLATHTIYVEPAPEPLLPISEVVPLQLFAFHMARRRGIDVDRPRNLSKAVLSE